MKKKLQKLSTKAINKTKTLKAGDGGKSFNPPCDHTSYQMGGCLSMP